MKKKLWSKLQRELYRLISDDINFQIHCVAYPMDSQYGSTDLPRYWITLNKEIIWDYPKQFVIKDETIPWNMSPVKNLSGFVAMYPYTNDISRISKLIREYIDTPKEELLSRIFENDYWGLINILRAADRRIGERRLNELKKKTHNIAANKVIAARMKISVQYKQ
jgi:hypothetical protein